MDDLAESVLKDYAIGRLTSAGDTRYLSGDLIRFLRYLGGEALEGPAGVELSREYLGEGEFYAPGAAYRTTEYYTLLRNPHIARNEEAVARPIEEGYYRKKYLSHLGQTDIAVNGITALARRTADFGGGI